MKFNPFIPVGQYAIRIYDLNHNKMYECSSQFNRVATHLIADALVTTANYCRNPETNEPISDSVFQQLSNSNSQTDVNAFDFTTALIDSVDIDSVGSVKCFLVTYDTLLTPHSSKSNYPIN